MLLLVLIFTAVLASCSGSSENPTHSSDTVSTGSTDTGSGGTGTGDTGGTGRWVPQVGDTWQWQLKGTINTSYDVNVYDIDLFDSTVATIQGLHDDGRRVVRYFSAGSYEDWRPDAGDFNSADLGNSLDGWDSYRWLDIRSTNVRNIMAARLDQAVQKGCDGLEPDNVDGYSNPTGISLTAADQLDYNRFLAQQAHQRNLAVALKNDVDQAADLAGDFDFTINEECHTYEECDALNVFITAGKPVFNAEYADQYVNDADARQSLCNDALAQGMHTLVLPLDLDDSFRYSCDDIGAGDTSQGSDGSVWEGHNWDITNGGMAGVAPGSPIFRRN
jgi:hypothetical protein